MPGESDKSQFRFQCDKVLSAITSIQICALIGFIVLLLAMPGLMSRSQMNHYSASYGFSWLKLYYEWEYGNHMEVNMSKAHNATDGTFGMAAGDAATNQIKIQRRMYPGGGAAYT